MDAAMILVLVLIACVIALLAWFEINSRRNEAKMELKSTLAESGLESMKRNTKKEDEPKTPKAKAA